MRRLLATSCLVLATACNQGAPAPQCVPQLETCNGADDDCDGEVDEAGEAELSCRLSHASASCAAGSCQVAACAVGFFDCDGAVANGCESALGTNDDCAACGDRCELTNAWSACTPSGCAFHACHAGFFNCDGNLANGCEIAQACLVAVCPAEQFECDGDPGTACETNITQLSEVLVDDLAEDTALALDAAGEPVVADTERSSTVSLSVHRHQNGVWQSVELVDADGGWWPSLEFDGQGTAHLAYYSQSQGALRYATDAGGTWQVTTVDPLFASGLHDALALDAQGQPHISYFRYTNYDRSLRYATLSGGLWQTQHVYGRDGQFSAIALDAQGNAHISFYDKYTTDVRHASNATGLWVVDTIDGRGESGSNVMTGMHSAAVFDAAGRLHVSYQEQTGRDLYHAVRSSTGAWAVTRIDADGDVGESTAMVIAPDGTVYIGYRDVTHGDLKLATGHDGAWSSRVVDSRDDSGGGLSIRRAADGRLHLAYLWLHDDAGTPRRSVRYALVCP